MERKRLINDVVISGTLAEIKLRKDISTKNQKTFIAGTVSIKVGENTIPVQVYQTELKHDGSPNKLFEEYNKMLNGDGYTSLAAADNQNQATLVFVPKNQNPMYGNGELTENIFYRDGREFITKRIRAGSIFKSTNRDVEEHASFDMEVFVLSLDMELDKEEKETGRLIIKGIYIDYAETANIFDFIVEDSKTVAQVRQLITPNSTVKLGGYLNFTSETIEEEIPSAIGESEIRKRTINRSDLVVTRGTRPYPREEALTRENIDAALAKRAAKIEENKEKDKEKAEKKAEATQPTKSSFDDLGF